jgi:hypothetical protein
MATAVGRPGEIWLDDCYYLDGKTRSCQRKYVLVLAVDPGSGDWITAVFTSKPHGLVEHPPCNLGPPRSGHFVGTPGGVLPRQSWVDFSSLQDLEERDYSRMWRDQRLMPTGQALPTPLLCAVLRCVLQSDDLTGRHAKLIGHLVAALRCP